MSDGGVEIVVKLGGALLADPGRFDAVVAAIGAAARDRRILVVPGGGPFADAVRTLDRQLQVSDDAAHWMAVLGMDQYAHLIAQRLTEGMLVDTPRMIAAALDAGRVPVLMPFRWLRDADPLPHTWDVTSDSIAAWIAGEVGASRVVLVKPPGALLRHGPGGQAAGGNLVDAYFDRALPDDVVSVIVPADQIEVLRSTLRGGAHHV